MPLTNKVSDYLPQTFQDDQGRVYKIKRTTTYEKSDAQLYGTEWPERSRAYSLDDGTEVVTDDAEETFTVLTKPPKRLTPKP